MTETFWIMVSAIATAMMAMATFATIAITLHQNREAVRARLIFSIVCKDEDVYLKVHNFGNSVATDIHLQFSQNFKDMLLTQSLKEKFGQLEQTLISIDAHDAKFYRIISVMSNEAADYTSSYQEHYTQDDVNKWHEQFEKEEFELNGTYCNRYHFKERMSIYSFLNVGAIEINEVAEVIRKQN